MDMYVLSRLFINFDKNKMTRGPEACRPLKYQKVKNAIIYGGAAHIEFYIKFFEKYFKKVPDLYIEQHMENKCITFDKPFDFFG